MTINREAAEQMSLRLTSAVDAMHTFAEAVRLATASLQETREVPEVKPGMVGTATVRGERDVKVFRVKRLDTSPLELWVSERLVAGCIQHRDHLVTSFVPDPDTAALRAEVERLEVELEAERTGACMSCNGTGVIDSAEHRCGFCNGQGYHVSEWETKFRQAERTIALQEARIAEYEVAKANLIRAQEIEEEARLFEQARADAAEARLARVKEHAIADAIIERYSSFDRLSARGIAQAVLALVAAADEQAAEAVRRPHDPSCNLMTSPCADCLQQASRG